jgi:AraC-like DNA-binding protein
VDELARNVALSRSALAQRFGTLVGEPPMRYLAAWRLHVARQLLTQPGIGIAEVAARVGYDSEAAFNRAFKRHVGLPPATWRRQNL